MDGIDVVKGMLSSSISKEKWTECRMFRCVMNTGWAAGDDRYKCRIGKDCKIMNREIKFRAKCKDNDEWVYGSYIQSYNEQDWIVQDGDFFAVDSDTVGQFTGFYDKNGKEIYEGDIIGCHNPDIVHLIFYNESQGRFMAALNGDIENDFLVFAVLMIAVGTHQKRSSATFTIIPNY